MTSDVIAFHCCSSYFLTFIFGAVRFVLIASPAILPPSSSYFLPVLSRGHFLKKFSALWSTFLTYGKHPSACRGRFYIRARSDSSSMSLSFISDTGLELALSPLFPHCPPRLPSSALFSPPSCRTPVSVPAPAAEEGCCGRQDTILSATQFTLIILIVDLRYVAM